MSLYDVRNPAQPLRERATELATPGVRPKNFSGAAQHQVGSPPIPGGDTLANDDGYTKHAAMYNIDRYDDPDAVYREDVTL